MREGPPQIGRFIFLRRLGSGGMGTVVAAYDPQLRRELAVKIVRGSTGPAVNKRLVAEAQAMAKIKHPNVGVVYEVVEVDDSVSIAMELVDGETLDAWARRERSVAERLDALVQAARGLQAAHLAGLVHCDFKPQNCLVDVDGRVRVLDFGLARALSGEPTETTGDVESTSGTDPHTRGVGGTLRYMPPEQARGRVDERSDQFSFGVTAYELLVGRHPFGADEGDYDPAQIHPQPTFANAKLPARIRSAIARSLEPDPRGRFPSLAELLVELEHDPSASRRTMRWLAGVVGVGAVAGTLGFWSASDDAETCDVSQVEALWFGARREAVRTAMTGVDVPYADDAWKGVATFVDDYVERLQAATLAVCDAEHSAADAEALRLAVLQRSCLDDRARELSAAIDVLEGADAGVVQRWAELVGGVDPLSRCDDPRLLLANEVEPLSTDAERAQARLLLEEYDAVEALLNAGRQEQAGSRAVALVESARELGHAPTLARALLAHAGVARRTRDFDLAGALCREAFAQAYASGDPQTGADAAIGLVKIEGDFAADPETAATWAEIADAALRRGRLEGRRRWLLLTNLGATALRSGDAKKAVALFRQRDALPEEDISRAEGRTDLAIALSQAGEHDEARATIDEVIKDRERTLGPHHPDVGFALANAGAMAGSAKDLDASVRYTERAIEILRTALGDDHPDLGGLESNLGASLVSLGRADEALEHTRRGAELTGKAFGDEHPRTAEAWFNLGRAQAKLGQTEEARALYLRALAVFEAKYGAEHPRSARVRQKLEEL